MIKKSLYVLYRQTFHIEENRITFMVSNLEDSNKFNSLSFTYTFILSGKFDNKSLTPENDLNMNILSESAKISFEVIDFLVQGNIIDDKFVN